MTKKSTPRTNSSLNSISAGVLIFINLFLWSFKKRLKKRGWMGLLCLKGTLFILTISLFSAEKAFSQSEQHLPPLSDKILLNPSYAGLNKNTSLWTGTSFFSESQGALDNIFFLSYDTFSEKLKGGIAFRFYQNLEGQANTSETGIGFSYSRPLPAQNERRIIPSLQINYGLATKQILVQAIDGMLGKQYEPPNPPGKEFLRYYNLRPKIGILLDSHVSQTGISAWWGIQQSLVAGDNQWKAWAPGIIVHYNQTIKNKHKGLISRTYQAKPGLMVLVTENQLLTRAEITISQTDHTYGLFLQNDFNQNTHGLGGTFGWRFNNLMINLSAATFYTRNFPGLAFFGEASLGLVIPWLHFDKKNPWEQPRKLF